MTQNRPPAVLPFLPVAMEFPPSFGVPSTVLVRKTPKAALRESPSLSSTFKPITPTGPGLMSTPTALLRMQFGMEGQESTSSTQEAKKTKSASLPAYTLQTIKLKQKLFTDSLSTLQALNSADPEQVIQGLHSSVAKLTDQFQVSLQWGAYSCETDRKRNSRQTGKIRQPCSADTEPCHLPRGQDSSLLSVIQTGRKKTVDTKHTLTQFEDWSGPSLRTGHCGLRAHLKRTDFSDTSLCECRQADQTPHRVLQSCPKYAEETSVNIAACC